MSAAVAALAQRKAQPNSAPGLDQALANLILNADRYLVAATSGCAGTAQDFELKRYQLINQALALRAAPQ